MLLLVVTRLLLYSARIEIKYCACKSQDLNVAFLWLNYVNLLLCAGTFCGDIFSQYNFSFCYSAVVKLMFVMPQCACASKVYIIIDFFKQYTMYKSNRPKDKRGGGHTI